MMILSCLLPMIPSNLALTRFCNCSAIGASASTRVGATGVAASGAVAGTASAPIGLSGFGEGAGSAEPTGAGVAASTCSPPNALHQMTGRLLDHLVGAGEALTNGRRSGVVAR